MFRTLVLDLRLGLIFRLLLGPVDSAVLLETSFSACLLRLFKTLVQGFGLGLDVWDF